MSARACEAHHSHKSACSSRASGLLLHLVIMALLWSQIQGAASQQPASPPTTLTLPHDPIFASPWVQSNIAVACSHKIQDGIGSQAIRLLSVYALSKALNIQHLFRPIMCVGHIGNQTFYHTTDCKPASIAQERLLTKAQHMIDMPSTITDAEVAKWSQVDLPWGPPKGLTTWELFVTAVTKAAKQKTPTVFSIKSLSDTIRDYPDIFLALPELRPWQPLPPLSCKGQSTKLPLPASQPSPNSPPQQCYHPKPWLMDALRVAIHIRRGDIVNKKIILPAMYYINLANVVAQVLDHSSCDFAIEVYIEAPITPQQVEEIKLLHHSIPNVVVLVDTDMLWTWQMMATSDILIMSNSMFSLSAALLNPNALVIQVPEDMYKHRTGQFMMSHWLYAATVHGNLSSNVLQRLQARVEVIQPS